MTNQYCKQPVKDVSISRLAGQRFSHHSTDICVSLTLMDPVFPWSAGDLPITTLMLFEVYPDAKLNMRALYTFTISSLMDVSTTWGAQTTRYHVENYFTTFSSPGVPPLTDASKSFHPLICPAPLSEGLFSFPFAETRGASEWRPSGEMLRRGQFSY